jgi:WD40 repeat protein
MYHRGAFEGYPLRTYASALLFSPTGSLIRQQFRHEEPRGIVIMPAMSNSWSACLQTLEGDSRSVNSVAFSHDSARLASASEDNTVKIWDASSGACLQTLAGYSNYVSLAELISVLALPQSAKAVLNPQESVYQELTISSDNIWVSNHVQQLWLPTEYRPVCTAVSGRYVGLGTGSGKVWMCRLK